MHKSMHAMRNRFNTQTNNFSNLEAYIFRKIYLANKRAIP
jgi:hypothetical protein